jgi:SulP family sulfate permease
METADRARARYRFDRLELAGSLGDLGTLLPFAIGMVMINGLNPSVLLLTTGLFYILAGLYFGVPTPVQPMKVIGAYAIATGVDALQITAAGFLVGAFLFILGATGIITFIGRNFPKPVIRGIQLSTGALLMVEGVRLILGNSTFQRLHQTAEPSLVIQSLGPVPIGVLIGLLCTALTLALLDNKRLPAGLAVVVTALALGVGLGRHQGLNGLQLGISIPALLPFGLPSGTDFTAALLLLALPQLPMTLGNAVIANADLARTYFGRAAARTSNRALCISMALANIGSFLVGGMPLCHGAGGLAAHYRFGARTAGSNLVIGVILVLLAILLGTHALAIFYLIPLSALGVLLLFAGSQLAMTILDLRKRNGLFVALSVFAITVASNLAAGFVCGLVLWQVLKSDRTTI